MAVYRAAANLALVDPKTGKVDPVAKAWKDKGHVVAFYDGRTATILTSHQESLGYGEPEGYRTCASVYFVAHRLGELFLTIGEKVVVFDLSFDHMTVGSPEKLRMEVLGSITNRK